MRGPRGFITLTITLLLSAGAMYGLLQILLAMSSYSSGILSPSIGQSMFTVLAFLELFMVCAITPAVTAGAISGEREKLTYEMLQSTPLSTSSIVWGKLVSALNYVFLLLFAAIPLASLVFIFGGVTLRDMFKALSMLVIIAISFGVLGLFMSALFKRTGRATVATFLVVLGLMFVPLLVAIAVGLISQDTPPRWILAPSPISMLSSVLGQASGQNGPLGGIIPILGGYFMTQAITPISQTTIPRPLYHFSIPLYAGGTIVLYFLTTRLLQPAHRWWLSKKEILVGIGLVLGLFLIVVGGYFSTASHYEWIQVTRPASQSMAVITVPAQPQGGPVTSQPLANVSPQEEIVLYSSVIRQIVTDMNTAVPKGSQPVGVYILGMSNLGNSSGKAQEVNLLTDEVQKSILEELKDLPNTIQWISSMNQMDVDSQTGQLKDTQSLITLQGASETGQDTVQIPASIQIGSGRKNNSMYNFKKVDGNWGLDSSKKPGDGTESEMVTPSAPATGLELTTQSDLYAAVVRQLYSVDHTSGNNSLKIPMIYILTTTNDEAGDPHGAYANPAKLGEDLQKSISERLKDLPADIRYVSERKDVPLDTKDGTVIDDGAIITLGNIFTRADGKMQIAGSIYLSKTVSGGRTYLLEKTDDLWKVTGTTGVEWSS
jgi:ABC-type transport system involved in multi-copper enzyme maturation permease subunit